jgi:hypothetical protein
MGYQKVKTQQWKEQEKDSSDYCSAEKKGAFFRQKKEVLRKMCGKEQCRRKKQKRVNCVKLMLIIYIKGSCYETPL